LDHAAGYGKPPMGLAWLGNRATVLLLLLGSVLPRRGVQGFTPPLDHPLRQLQTNQPLTRLLAAPGLSPNPEYIISYANAREAPGPYNWPFVGNMMRLARLGGFDQYDKYMVNKYGPICRATLFGHPWFLLSSPEEVRQVLMSRSYEFEDRMIPPTLQELNANMGLIFTNGEEHEVSGIASKAIFVL